MIAVVNAREEDLVVQSSDMALMNVASLHASGSLDLSPRFQRRDRWDRERQSQLIESFILNVPVPPVYLAEESRGVFAVIDGKQRLTAIAQYMDDEFFLTKLQLLKDLEGLKFSQLGSDIASTLRLRPLRAVTILRQTPDWVKHEVFVRLNRGGQPLNAQEIRNVSFASPLNDQLIGLAENQFLHRQLKITSTRSSAYADMSNVEIVVRFFALSETWNQFGGNLRNALDQFMLDRHLAGPAEVAALSARFSRAIGWCESLWGNHAFQRFDGQQWRDQMIGGVYDAEMIAVDSLSDDQLRILGDRKDRVLNKTAQLFSDPQFDGAVRLSTNTSARVRYRIERMSDLLESLV